MAIRFLYLLSVLIVFSGPTSARSPLHAAPVTIDIIGDDGRAYPVYDVGRQQHGPAYRAYLEAVYGHNYAIRVRNNSGRRLGLVIAVDGRNIISGQKSDLLESERMYILDPWQSASYSGWRTSNNHINQFFFTDAADSYAGAWQDHSAMGVIAIAVFNEKREYRPYLKKSAPRLRGRQDMPGELESSADRAEADSVLREPSKQARTGFGEEKYSDAKVVQFSPEKVAAGKYFYKYEWRQALCQQGIIDCRRQQSNRFWPEHEQGHAFAPHPPAAR